MDTESLCISKSSHYIFSSCEKAFHLCLFSNLTRALVRSGSDVWGAVSVPFHPKVVQWARVRTYLTWSSSSPTLTNHVKLHGGGLVHSGIGTSWNRFGPQWTLSLFLEIHLPVALSSRHNCFHPTI